MEKKARIKPTNDLQYDGSNGQNVCCFDCCILKKFHLRKVLLFLALLQIAGIWYVYRSSRYFWGKLPEGTPHADLHDVNYNHRQTGSVFHLPLTEPADMSKYYVEIENDVWCLSIGSKNYKTTDSGKCICLDGWSGSDCGVPPTIWDSGFLKKGKATGIKIQRRKQPRRLIYSIWSKGDFDLINKTLHHLSDIVDVFLVGHLNKSTSTDNTSTVTSIQLYATDLAYKIVYINVNESQEQIENLAVWMQQQIWYKAKTVLSDLRPDDIVLMSDDTSIPLIEILTFFKLYNGFTEPILFYIKTIETHTLLTNNATSNLSKQSAQLSPYIAACTFEFMRYICSYDAQLVWTYDQIQYKEKVKRFEKHNWNVNRWYAGSVESPAALKYQFHVQIYQATLTNSTESNVTIVL